MFLYGNKDIQRPPYFKDYQMINIQPPFLTSIRWGILDHFIENESTAIPQSKNTLCDKSLDFVPQYTSERVCGLENLGNSCYVNSAIQCLSHIRPLTQFLLKLYEEKRDLPPLTTAYVELIAQLWLGSETFTSAADVTKHVSEIAARFAGRKQEDSHEFLTILLEAIHHDLEINGLSLESNLVHGTIKSTVTCLRCKLDVTTYDSFMSLPLPIPLSPAEASGLNNQQGMLKYIAWTFSFVESVLTPNVDIYKCLDLFFKTEFLCGNSQWYCAQCDQLTDAVKKLDLWTLPKVLILQLKRFSYDLSDHTKIQTFVEYPSDYLNLTKYISNPDSNNNYDLVAISTHTGSLIGGHYTTYAKNFFTKRWHFFTDKNVYDIDENSIITSDAYILVYVLQNFL